METFPLTPERKAQLDACAQRHGKDATTALDEVLADARSGTSRNLKNPFPPSGKVTRR
jgi:hypothetical protein